MATIVIRESFAAYIEAFIDVTDEELAELRAKTPAEVKAWADERQEEGDLDWQYTGLDCEGDTEPDRIYWEEGVNDDERILFDVALKPEA